jgi:hypothetical protein
LLAELAWGMLKFGDPLARLHAVLFPRTEPAKTFIETEPLRILMTWPDILLKKPGGWVFVALLMGGVGLGIFGSFRGDRRWQLLTLWLIGGWLFFTAVAMLPVFLLEEGSVYLRMKFFRYWSLILPPMFVAGLVFVRYIIEKVMAITGSAESALSFKLATAAVTSALLLNSTMMAVAVTDRDELVRNGGNRDYIEFREFAARLDERYELVLLDIPRNTPVHALPMFLNSWDGSQPIWRGQVRRARPENLDKLARDDGERLLVLDLTKSEGQAEKGHPAELLDRLDAEFENIFRSSSGYVLVYRLG